MQVHDKNIFNQFKVIITKKMGKPQYADILLLKQIRLDSLGLFSTFRTYSGQIETLLPQ